MRFGKNSIQTLQADITTSTGQSPLIGDLVKSFPADRSGFSLSAYLTKALEQQQTLKQAAIAKINGEGYEINLAKMRQAVPFERKIRWLQAFLKNATNYTDTPEAFFEARKEAVKKELTARNSQLDNLANRKDILTLKIAELSGNSTSAASNDQTEALNALKRRIQELEGTRTESKEFKYSGTDTSSSSAEELAKLRKQLSAMTENEAELRRRLTGTESRSAITPEQNRMLQSINISTSKKVARSCCDILALTTVCILSFSASLFLLGRYGTLIICAGLALKKSYQSRTSKVSQVTNATPQSLRSSLSLQ